MLKDAEECKDGGVAGTRPPESVIKKFSFLLLKPLIRFAPKTQHQLAADSPVGGEAAFSLMVV